MSVEGSVEGGLDEPTDLEPEQGSLDLASPEDQHTQADWEEAAATVLRKSRRMKDDEPDSAVWDWLGTDSLAGIEIPVLGTPDMLDGLTTSGRPTRQGEWDVRTRLAGSDATALNEIALVDLDGGVTSLWLEAGADTDFAALLDGVLLDLAPVVLDAQADPLGVAEAFLSFAGDRVVADRTNLGADPIGAWSRRGGFETGASAPSSTNDVVAVATLARGVGVLGVVVDATVVHDQGASEYLELPYSLAVGATYLRAMVDAGLSVQDALGLMEFRYAATDDQFLTIAKLRAARRVWARVAELSGADAGAEAQRQHAVTSRPMMGKYDPWVNMLRTTVAAFAAGVGGADAVTVLPFDSVIGASDALGRRIARNTSALLIHESHVATVVDPAGGSYVVEKMTDDLAQVAWQVFGEIEELGGIETAIADGWLTGMIGDNAGARRTRINQRRQPLTGITEFPNLDEVLPERPAHDAFAHVRRYGADFEALRDEPPTSPVFLATLGPVASHTARASFATNLFAAGGVAVDVAGATAGVEELVAAYGDQHVVCLAGSNAAYAEWGSEAVAALRAAGATWVIVAGVSTGSTTEVVGRVDDSCAAGVDALDFLTRTREKLS